MNLTCKIALDTIIKQSPEPASRLAEKHKARISKGEYEILKWEQSSGNHFKVTFVRAIKSIAGNEYYTWLVYGDHISILKDGKPDFSKDLLLKVEHMSQRDNKVEWYRTCNTSSHAMLANYLKPGCIKGDDDYYNRFVAGKGDTTDWEVHTRALKSLGIESVFRTDLDYEDVERQLAKGIPTPIGVMHKGHVSSPEGGHVILIVGVKGDSWIANDPYGEGFAYTNTKGEGVEYPKYPTLDSRWIPGEGYGRLIKSVDGKPV